MDGSEFRKSGSCTRSGEILLRKWRDSDGCSKAWRAASVNWASRAVRPVGRHWRQAAMRYQSELQNATGNFDEAAYNLVRIKPVRSSQAMTAIVKSCLTSPLNAPREKPRMADGNPLQPRLPPIQPA